MKQVSPTTDQTEVQKCTKCKADWPTTDFARSKNRPSGRHPICKHCRSVYYEANKERLLPQYKSYRTKNQERINKKAREYAGVRFFYKTATNSFLRSPETKYDVKLRCAELSRLWKQQRGVCAITGRRLNKENAQLDHIIPLKKGGSNGVSNLRWIHRDVNYAKRDLMDDTFLALCLDVVIGVTSYRADLRKPLKTYG